jgi:type VI secretion system protein ImpG
MSINRAGAVRTSSTSAELKLSCETTEGGRASVFSAPLTLYLHGEFSNAAQLFRSLMKHCQGVSLRDRSGKERLRLRSDALVAPAFHDESMLFPWPALVPTGFARLQEYFTLPQKFFFIEVRGLEKAPPLTEDGFELVFLLDELPPIAGTLSAENFKLSCAPVINLFSTSTEPLRQTTAGQEHFLRASGLSPQHAEIFSVEQVVGVRQGERAVYQPFSLFPHLSQAKNRSFFQLRRTKSALDAGADVTLSIGSPLEVKPQLSEEILSVDVTCTNRLLAGRLGLGDINRGVGVLPGGARVRNLCTVSQPVSAPLGSELHWRLLSHLAVTQRTVVEEQALRGLLSLYNLQTLGDVGVARGNSARIDAIRGVRAEPARRLYKGALVQGTRLALEIEEKNFASLGDLYLFGCVLDALFASFVSMNSFSELNFKTLPSQLEFVWPIRIGTKRPL